MVAIRGKLIGLIGLDGSGKTTQIELLRKHLVVSNYKATVIRMNELEEISNRQLINFIRKHNFDFTNAEIDILRSAFMMQSKIDSEIIPCLNKGEIVLSDRYTEVNYLFAKLLGVRTDFLDLVWNDSKYYADMKVFLKVSPDECYERILQRNKDLKSHETLENLMKANEYYLDKAVSDEYVVVNGSESAETVHNHIWKYIQPLIEKLHIGNTAYRNGRSVS